MVVTLYRDAAQQRETASGPHVAFELSKARPQHRQREIRPGNVRQFPGAAAHTLQGAVEIVDLRFG